VSRLLSEHPCEELDPRAAAEIRKIAGAST